MTVELLNGDSHDDDTARAAPTMMTMLAVTVELLNGDGHDDDTPRAIPTMMTMLAMTVELLNGDSHDDDDASGETIAQLMTDNLNGTITLHRHCLFVF